jgi:ribosomal protein S18 acetylase RimI-like enzyme
METVDNLQIRKYREGDAAALVTLWNNAHREYGGYVPRTASYWNWCILSRPGVLFDDILVGYEGSTILGYGVIDPKGYVLELAIEPTLPIRRRREVVAMLCDALEKRARAKGIPAISMYVPAGDQAMCEVLRASEYGEGSGGFSNMMIVNPVKLIQRVLDHRRKSIPQGWVKTFLLEFSNGHYRFNPFPKVYVQINNELIVTPATTDQPVDCRISLSLSVFAELIFNRLTFQSALTSGEVAVAPRSEVYGAQQLLSLVTLRGPWYSPFADRR